MSRYIVESIDPGCDCCSYIAIAAFDTLEETLEFIGADENLTYYEEDYE